MTPHRDPEQNELLDPSFVITRALETVPEVNVPPDFAAKVCAALPATTAPRVADTRTSWIGVRLAVVALAMLLVAGFGFAALAASGSTLWQTATYAASGEAAALLGLLGLLRRPGPGKAWLR